MIMKKGRQRKNSEIYLSIETVRVFYLLSRFIVILHRCKCHAFLKWLPQIKQSVCCVIGEVKAINICVACILQSTVHGATQRVSTYCYGKTLQQRGQLQSQDYWSVRKDGQTAVCVAKAGCVAACLQSGTKKKLWCSFVYICVQTASWAAVCVSVFVEWRTE